MIAPIFYGSVDAGGNLRIYKGKEYRQYIASLQGEVQIVVRRPQKIASDPERRYYRGVVVPIIADFFGRSREWTHRWIQKNYFVIGERRGSKIVQSTLDMTTQEFEERMAEIRTDFGSGEWLKKNGAPAPGEGDTCFIPQPNEADLGE